MGSHHPIPALVRLGRHQPAMLEFARVRDARVFPETTCCGPQRGDSWHDSSQVLSNKATYRGQRRCTTKCQGLRSCLKGACRRPGSCKLQSTSKVPRNGPQKARLHFNRVPDPKSPKSPSQARTILSLYLPSLYPLR